MRQRKSLPDAGQPWMLVDAWDPFIAADLERLRDEARARLQHRAKGDLKPSALGLKDVARELSGVCLAFMQSRRHYVQELREGPYVARLDRIAMLALDLRRALGPDFIDLLSPDFGHSAEVRQALGLPHDLHKLDWEAADSSAREIRAQIDLDLPKLLDVVSATARAHADLERSRVRQGPRPDMLRQRFLDGLLTVYGKITGAKPGVSRPDDASEHRRRGGPAAGFVAAVCHVLAERLTDDERAADPQLATVLAEYTDEARAATRLEKLLRQKRAWLPWEVQEPEAEMRKAEQSGPAGRPSARKSG